MNLRSRVPELLARVEEADGVIVVHDDLTWEVDDVAPRPLSPPLL